MTSLRFFCFQLPFVEENLFGGQNSEVQVFILLVSPAGLPLCVLLPKMIALSGWFWLTGAHLAGFGCPLHPCALFKLIVITVPHSCQPWGASPFLALISQPYPYFCKSVHYLTSMTLLIVPSIFFFFTGTLIGAIDLICCPGQRQMFLTYKNVFVLF